jgi:hypothetical protein
MMETLQKRPGLFKLVVFVAIVAVFMGAQILLKPKPVTNTKNVQYNDWMRYFFRQPGYTVEYMDLETFEESVDVMTVAQTMSALADHVTLFSLGPDWETEYQNAVRTGRSGKINEALRVRQDGDYPATVYYDDEELAVFYIGLGSDPDLVYGYYTKIQVER